MRAHRVLAIGRIRDARDVGGQRVALKENEAFPGTCLDTYPCAATNLKESDRPNVPSPDYDLEISTNWIVSVSRIERTKRRNHASHAHKATASVFP
jgi:hypothetical protein